MINTKYLLCISTCLLVSGNIQASDINLTYDSSGFLPDSLSLYTLHTPSELRPTPSFNTENTIKLAAVCAIGGGGCNGLSFGSSDNSMKLDKNLQCEIDGFVNSCPSGYVPDTTQRCPHSTSYFKCRPCINNCDSGYSFTTCNSSTQVQTAAYRNECTNTCYQCRYKTCAEGGYAASINSCQNGTTVSFANKTCYRNVSAKTCENGGYKSSVPTNNKCTAVNYCSKTCQTNCYQPTCEEGGYKSSVPTNNVCTPVTYYGRTCYKDCYQPTCENGNYKSGIPTNQVCSSVSYYGRTCYQNCYQPQCATGGYVDACPANQTGTPVTYYGRNCLKNCYQPTCENGGYKSSIPANNTCTSVTYYGRNCYKECVTISTPLPILYSDMTTANEIISGKTPIGIVFDTNNKLAMALEESRNELQWGDDTDIPTLVNYDSEPLACGMNGKSNTAAIIAYGKANNVSYPAAEYCYNYTTAGTKAGDWFLPSYAQLKQLYSVKDKVKVTQVALDKHPFDSNNYWSNDKYWSSNENNGSYAWGVHIGYEGNRIIGIKPNTYKARPVLAFGETKEVEIKCQIGSILYEDKKCYSSSTKTPIAVVFDLDKKLAMALEQSSNELQWVKNLQHSISWLEECDDRSTVAVSCGTSGKLNTTVILNDGKDNNISYPAAEYCYNYTTAGTKAGDWFLPSLYDLKNINDNKDIINTAINLLGRGASFNSNPTYWSSTGENPYNSWYFSFLKDGSKAWGKNKSKEYLVRPVIAFGETKEVEIECQIGSVLYEDKRCYSYTTKTPIAVVFDLDKKLATAAKVSSIKWGDDTDIPTLANCDSEPLTCGTNGKANTAAILTYGKANNTSYPAAEYCYNYTTAGTKAGDWFLPSYAQLKQLYSVKDKVNETIERFSLYPFHTYWSSTELNNNKSWIYGSSSYNYKNSNSYVRPVLAY